MGMAGVEMGALAEAASRIGHETGLDPNALLAVAQVESRGRVFAQVDGRNEPLIRFEGHYFYRLLGTAKRNRAVVAGLAHPRAGKVRNPITQAGRWAMLHRAEAIDRNAALASVSWGCGQVMGDHWRWLGYASIGALVTDARSGAEGQVRLMARFIVKAGLADRLADRDWAGFARAYNGPGYRANRYDTKMAEAFEAITGEPPARPRHAPALLRLGSRGPAVEDLQRQLRGLGHALIADGDFGPATEAALKAFQAANGLVVDGAFGAKAAEVMARRLPRGS